MNGTSLDPRRPLVSRRSLLVAVGHAVDCEISLAREFGLGVEVQLFANPAVLARDFAARLRGMAKRLTRIKGPIGCHGAFIDTVHFSLDREIRAVARKRYLQALDVAEALGAGYVVLHSQYNPCIRIPTYDDLYFKQSLACWPGVLREAERRGIHLYLENMFDDSPRPLRRLVDALNSPHLKLCLDPAHVRVHSHLDLGHWVHTFAPHLRHLHLSDSTGKYDEHLPLGAGTVDFRALFRALRENRIRATHALETGRATRRSLAYLGFGTTRKPAGAAKRSRGSASVTGNQRISSLRGGDKA